jgi:hypothetical protein
MKRLIILVLSLLLFPVIVLAQNNKCKIDNIRLEIHKTSVSIAHPDFKFHDMQDFCLTPREEGFYEVNILSEERTDRDVMYGYPKVFYEIGSLNTNLFFKDVCYGFRPFWALKHQSDTPDHPNSNTIDIDQKLFINIIEDCYIPKAAKVYIEFIKASKNSQGKQEYNKTIYW